MQLRNKFDPETLQKVKRSGLISLGGFLVAVLPMLLPDILNMLQGHPVAAAAVGSLGPWIVATVKNWMQGRET